jgi:PAS domain S-box-containing protein
MLKEVVGRVTGRLPVLPVVSVVVHLPAVDPLGLLVVPALHRFGEPAEGIPMPAEDRAVEPGGTGSGTLEEVTLRALIKHIPVTVYIDRLDETGSNVYTSPRLEAELGYSVEEWVSDKDLYAKVLHPEDRERVLAEYMRRRDSDVPFRAEYRMIARDGAVHWYHDEAAVIRDETGRPAYFHGFLLNITEQKQLAEALRSSEQELRRQKQYVESLVEINPTAIVTVGLDGSVTSWNLAAEELFGYSRQEAIGRKLDDLVAAGEGPRGAAVSYEEVLEAGRFHTVTQRARRDGTLADIELTVVPVIEEGTSTGYLVIYHDISRLQRQKQYYESLLDVSPTAIVTVDPGHRVTSWNPAAEKLFGYSREEAMGQDVDSLVASTAAVYHEALRLSQQTMEAGEVHLTTRRTRKDGSLVNVDVRAAPIRVGGEMVGLYALYHDISELQRAREQAEAATQAKSAFLAMMSHEIRTPLNAVIGMTGLLLDTDLTPEQRSYAEVIRSSGDALMAVIAGILDFSKIEAGRLELERGPFDLRNCVESALELVAASASSKRLELAYFMAPGVPPVIIGDATRLRQIVVNLLNNAVKFTDKGEVVLSVDGAALVPGGKHRLHFAVRDTGIGIPEGRLNSLFESFSQLDASTTRRYGGTGLGLAISKRLAELMGGTIWAESRVGEGSTFHFTIEAEQATGLDPAHERGAPPQLQGRRVLIVDDNATNRHILGRQVESWGMLARDTAYAAQAVEWIGRGDPFDLAILDMQMPDMDGLTLAEEIRRFRDARSLPLVMLTSLGPREEALGSVEFAASLTKPVKPSQLYDTLMNVFSTAPAGVQATGPREQRGVQLAEPVPLRILVAEDNVVNQQLALLLLKKIGYRADVAANGLQVLQALERATYDVVIMDVQMPEMDGLEATRQIYQRWHEGRPYVIAATANAMQDEREACLAAGMDAYLSKPIHVDELAAALSRCRPHPPLAPPAPARQPGASSQPPSPKQPGPQGLAFTAGIVDSAALERLVKITADDPGLLPALIDTFLTDVPRLVEDAKLGLQQGHSDDVRRAGHTLKSTAATFGATRFSELSRSLESLATSGTLDGAADLIARLEAEYQKVRIALETVRERDRR